MANNSDLLRPFDLTQAEAGDAICWSHLNEPIKFIGECVDGSIAIQLEDGKIETPFTSGLRMKPLFWKDGKPVYRGDSLWHKISERVLIVDRLQEDADAEKYGFFYDTQGVRARADLCLWEEPKPQPLFQLQGKDVFKGDRLWHNRDKYWVTVTEMYLTGDFIDENGIGRSPCYCQWEKPKNKIVRYANVYNRSNPHFGKLFADIDAAKNVPGRNDAIGIARIEWEE